MIFGMTLDGWESSQVCSCRRFDSDRAILIRDAHALRYFLIFCAGTRGRAERSGTRMKAAPTVAKAQAATLRSNICEYSWFESVTSA